MMIGKERLGQYTTRKKAVAMLRQNYPGLPGRVIKTNCYLVVNGEIKTYQCWSHQLITNKRGIK